MTAVKQGLHLQRNVSTGACCGTSQLARSSQGSDGTDTQQYGRGRGERQGAKVQLTFSSNTHCTGRASALACSNSRKTWRTSPVDSARAGGWAGGQLGRWARVCVLPGGGM